MKSKMSQIKINPVHDQIYSSNEIEDLVESMEKNGLLEPLVVTPDHVIVSGHRRYLAAKFLGWDEIEIVVREIDTEDMEFTMVSANQYRRKKSAEVLNEIQRLYQNYSKNLSAPDSPSNPEKEHDAHNNASHVESWYW